MADLEKAVQAMMDAFEEVARDLANITETVTDQFSYDDEIFEEGAEEMKETNGRDVKRHTHEEVLNALRVIRDTCVSYGYCRDGCPLAYDDLCYLNEIGDPADWRIKTEDDSEWTAFIDAE